jgi:hypothetical protein
MYKKNPSTQREKRGFYFGSQRFYSSTSSNCTSCAPPSSVFTGSFSGCDD